MSRLSISLALAAILLCLPTRGHSAEAQPAPAPSPLSLNEKLKRAIADFNAERFEEARAWFLEVYQSKPDPRLLFNLGSCYRRLNQLNKAIEYYEIFVQSVPQSPLAPEARAYIAEMRAKLDVNKYALDKEQSELRLHIAEQRAREAENIAKANLEARRQTEAEILKQSQREPPRPIYKRAWFWGVIGAAGVAAIGTGLAIGLWQRSQIPPEPDSDLGAQGLRF